MGLIRLLQTMLLPQLIETQNSNNNNFLTKNESGVLPVAQGGTGGATAAQAVANLGVLSHYGTQTISRSTNSTDNGAANFGFRPKLVRIRAFVHATNCDLYDSDGGFDGTNMSCMWKYGSAGLAPNSSGSSAIMLHSGNAGQSATCAFTDTGIAMFWTTFGAGLPAGTIIMKIDVWG